MLETLVRLLPVVLAMGFGALLRRRGMARAEEGDFLFRVVILICLPALVFSALSQIEITQRLLVFSGTALAAICAGFVVGRLIGGSVDWPPTQAAVLLMSCMIVNSGFVLPFAQPLCGAEGVARIAAFDAVNTTLVFTWIYGVAAAANPQHEGRRVLLNRIVRSPPLYGIAAGLLVNVAGVSVPDAA